MADIRLSQRDLEHVLDLAGRCGAWSPDAAAVEDLLDAVRAIVRGDIAFWNWYHLGRTFEEHALVGARRAPVRARCDSGWSTSTSTRSCPAGTVR